MEKDRPMSPAGRFRRVLPAAAAALCALLPISGCSGHSEQEAAGAKPDSGSAPAVRPATVERLAAALGCRADITLEAQELRQGACHTVQGEYRLLTFADRTGQRAWLTEARDYGGTYLVGERWTVTGESAAALEGLRVQLGGTIERGETHGADDASAGDAHADHPESGAPGHSHG